MFLALLATAALTVPARVSTQSTPQREETAALVIGARSYSPMVENVDAVMAFYARLGLKTAPPEKGDSYPWDTEEWHYDLHGGQAPRSQMRFTYATVPGAVRACDPAAGGAGRTPGHRPETAGRARAGSRCDDARPAGARPGRGSDAPAGVVASARAARDGVRRHRQSDGVVVPGAHLVELLQLDPIPQTTASSERRRDRRLDPRDRCGSRSHAEPLPRQVWIAVQGSRRLRRGIRRTDRRKRGEAAAGDRDAAGHQDDARIPRGDRRRSSSARCPDQDPGAARLQLTVRNLEQTLDALRGAGPSTVVSTGGRIITQPQYRVAVVSDLNGLFLVLTDRPAAAQK